MDGYRWRCVECGAHYDAYSAGCTMCFAPGSILRVGIRASATIDAAPEVTSAAALAKAAWTLVTSAVYPSLRIGRGALVLIYGAPGQGKSTFATRFLDGLHGPVILQSVEEAPGPSLHARLERCHVRRNDFTILGRASVDQIVDCVRTRGAVGLAIDSVQMAAFTADELRHLLLVLPTLQTVLAIAQVNKSGRVEGRERLMHEADVAIECERDVDALRWHVVKSRYEPVGRNGNVLDQPEGVLHANA